MRGSARSKLPLESADMVTARAARLSESERYGRVEAALRCRSTSVTVSLEACPWKSSTALPLRNLKLWAPIPATSTPAEARAWEVGTRKMTRSTPACRSA